MSKSSISTKWIVIAVVAIVFLIIFREDISLLLGRTERVIIDPTTGVITLETPLGTTDVTFRRSQRIDYRSLYPADRFVTYTSSQYRYAISYPRHSVWIEPSALGPYWQQKIESVDGYSKAIIAPGEGSFAAMVVVRVYQTGSLGIREALLGFHQAAVEGVSYEAPRIDLATNSATQVGFDRILNKAWVSRLIVVKGLLYDLRAAFSPDVSSQIKEEMNEIVNSFQMLG